MAYHLNFHPEAVTELDEALSWYHEQQAGLEEAFFEDYLAIENRLIDTPQHFPAVLNQIRRANFSHFPYSIFFEVELDSIFIYAIFNQSRNPEEWVKRV
jgi:plasmid stabilization system protein ParE